jgi:hypothetical protein
MGAANGQPICGDTGFFTCIDNQYVLNTITHSSFGTTCTGGNDASCQIIYF